MNKFRVVHTKKEGHYEYYRVQERCLFVIWLDKSRAFDTLNEAQQYIKNESVKETVTVLLVDQ